MRERSDIRALEERTRAFGVAAIRLRSTLKGHPEYWDLLGQLSRSACSVAANHRAMTRARSTREFAAKLQIVHEEADEAAHWLRVLLDCHDGTAYPAAVSALLDEAEQLRNIFGRARATTRRNYFT